MSAASLHRIAYVIGELGKGGAEYQLHELVRHLDREQFLPHVFVLSGGGWWAQPIRALDVTVTEFPRRVPADVARVSGLRAALRRFAPAVLHTVLWSGNCYGRAAALGLPIGVRIAAERNVIRRPRWQRLVERALDRVTDVHLVNCQAVADELVIRGRLPATKMRVIANGIDLGRMPPFTPDRRAARAAVGFDPGRRLVAQVGRLAAQKDYPTFLRAVVVVAAVAPDVDFLVVGGGKERARLEVLARELGLGARVHFMGERNDVPTLLAGVDVLALTSRFEGFPNVVLEAMATGAVAVASDVGGCSEVVVAGETGLLVRPGDPAAAAAAMLRVLRDGDFARRLVLAARRRVEAEFSLGAMARRTMDVYLTELGRHERPAKGAL